MKTLAEVLKQAPTKRQMIGPLDWVGMNVRVPVGYRVVLVSHDDVMDAEGRAGVRVDGKGVVCPLAAA